MIYHENFKILNLVVNNNSFPPTKIIEENNVIYQLKCPLGECISDNKIITEAHSKAFRF